MKKGNVLEYILTYLWWKNRLFYREIIQHTVKLLNDSIPTAEHKIPDLTEQNTCMLYENPDYPKWYLFFFILIVLKLNFW